MAGRKTDEGVGARSTQSEDEALDWFMRLQDDHASETLLAFEDWERTSPENARAYADLLRMTSMPSLHWATVVDRVHLVRSVQPTSARRKFSGWKAGLTVATTLMAGIVCVELPSILVDWRADYISAVGQRQTVTLPDGSKVELNTASAIAIDFADGKRRVSLLRGDAFFDVTHDPAHPFVVAGRFADVEVKGTAFGVATTGPADTVVLERGHVEVRSTTIAPGTADLQPDQMVTATERGLSEVMPADPYRSLAWRDGRVVFHDRPFDRALADLKRYYDGQVFVATGRFASVLVSGNYRTDDPDAAIRTLATSAGAQITRLPGGILILR
jgi:transmembrane sensor